jgi:hypothetical protein
MAHYISWVLRHGEKEDYVYGEHIGPWEVISGNYESGVTRKETAKNLGIVFKPAPKLSRVEGINAVLMLLGKCVIDDVKCARLIEALIEYRRKIDRTTKEYKEEPLHNWASHAADALRYLATGRRNKHMAKKKRPRYTQKRVGSDKREGASWMSA